MIYVNTNCFALCREWPTRFGGSWEQATVVPWIWACDDVDGICFRSQCTIKNETIYTAFLVISGLLFAFWSLAMMNTIFSSCDILLWGNGLLLWWLHHKLCSVFDAMIALPFFYTWRMRQWSWPLKSIFLISFYLFHDSWGDGQLVVPFFGVSSYLF